MEELDYLGYIDSEIYNKEERFDCLDIIGGDVINKCDSSSLYYTCLNNIIRYRINNFVIRFKGEYTTEQIRNFIATYILLVSTNNPSPKSNNLNNLIINVNGNIISYSNIPKTFMIEEKDSVEIIFNNTKIQTININLVGENRYTEFVLYKNLE